MQHKTPASVVEDALNDPSRICPVFAAPAMISGQRLSVQWRGESITVRAPRPMLQKLFEWCQGDRSLTELGKLSVQTWGDDRMSRFVADLLDAGVMVDAAVQLPAMAAATVDPLGPVGLPAQAEVWAAVAKLSVAEEAGEHVAVALPPPADSSLQAAFRKRCSARAYGEAQLSQTTLAEVMQAAYGVVDSEVPLGSLARRRTVPSAGGLHALRWSLVLPGDVGTLTAGCYTVQSHGSASDGTGMKLVREASDVADMFRAAIAPDDLLNVRAIVVAWADLSLVALKYRNRTYPFMMFETGAAFQNVALHCAMSDLAWSPYGNYDPVRLAEVCALPAQASVLAVGLLGSAATLCADAPTPSLPLVLNWSDDLETLPFHVAKARIDVETDTEEFAWGRAKDPVLAADKAIAEAVERYAYRSPKRLHWGTLAELPLALDPSEIVAFTPAQYRRHDFPFVPLTQHDRALWTEAQYARDGRDVLVHADCVFHRRSLEPLGADAAYCWSSSSGCASHISPAQARQAAIWELIERDAFMRHWTAQRPGIRIQEDTLPQEMLHRIAWLREQGCDVSLHVLDAGALPATMAVIQNEQRHFTCFGAGAGEDLAHALDAALSEAEVGAHARLAALAASVVKPADVSFPWDHADIYATRRYFRRADCLVSGAEVQTLQACESRFGRNSTDVTLTLLDKGFEPIFVDLSLPDAPTTLRGSRLSTVRALVPGLVPITFGYGKMPLGTLGKLGGFEAAALFPHPFA